MKQIRSNYKRPPNPSPIICGVVPKTKQPIPMHQNAMSATPHEIGGWEGEVGDGRHYLQIHDDHLVGSSL